MKIRLSKKALRLIDRFGDAAGDDMCEINDQGHDLDVIEQAKKEHVRARKALERYIAELEAFQERWKAFKTKDNWGDEGY